MTRAFALCLALATGPVWAQPAPSENPRVGEGIAALAYGIYCPSPTERLEDAPGTAAGVVNIISDVPDIEHAQTLIPAALGVGFGVVLQAEPDVIYDSALVTITHPPYPDSGIAVEQWITSIDGLGPNLVGFTFEIETELVIGAWTFAAQHEGKELFHITFEVVPPELLPGLRDLCAGAFMS